jgi:hypothetical protein
MKLSCSTSDGYTYSASCTTSRLDEIRIEQDRLRGETQEDISPIYEIDGDYRCDADDYESVSLKQFLSDVEYYKENREKILSIRENNERVFNEIIKLEREIGWTKS